MKRYEIRERAILGGKGSGNWGHAGRPGKRGGSMSRSSAMSLKTGKDWKARQASARNTAPRVEEDQEGMDKWWRASTRRFGPEISQEGANFDPCGRKGNCEFNARGVFKNDPAQTVYYGTILRQRSDGRWRPLDGGHFFNVRDGKITDTSPIGRDRGQKVYYFGVPLTGMKKSTSGKQMWRLADGVRKTLMPWNEAAAEG